MLFRSSLTIFFDWSVRGARHLQSANFTRHSPFVQIVHGHADAYPQGLSFAHNLRNQRFFACYEPGDEVPPAPDEPRRNRRKMEPLGSWPYSGPADIHLKLIK